MPVIVIVDDRATNRAVLGKLASSLSARVQVQPFDSPSPALEWISRNPPDLVITDFKMPSMDGADFIRRLRAMPNCFDVPVVVVTVYEERELRYRALDAGATDFLISPLDHREFRARISNLLTLRHQQEIIRRRAVSLEERLQVTNKLRADELRQSEDRLNAVINGLPALITVRDATGYITMANRACEEFFALGTPIVGQHWDSIGLPRGGSDHGVFDRRILDGETICMFEEELEDSDGRVVSFKTTKLPLLQGDGPSDEVLTVSVDISEQKRAETVLLDAKLAAELANRSKSEFLANTSHELRTPLNAIIGFAEVLSTELLGPVGTMRYKEYAGDILGSAEHLLGLIEDILDISQIESGRLSLVESRFSVRDVVRNVVRFFEAKAEDLEVTIEIDVDPSLELWADERRFKQVLSNLVSNGVKFSTQGGHVKVASALAEGGDLTVAVADEGIGIAEDDVKLALARFGRLRSPGNTPKPGAGLGLSLALELTELHGGKLNIESSVGEGTTVVATFPAARVLTANQASTPSSGE